MMSEQKGLDGVGRAVSYPPSRRTPLDADLWDRAGIRDRSAALAAKVSEDDRGHIWSKRICPGKPPKKKMKRGFDTPDKGAKRLARGKA